MQIGQRAAQWVGHDILDAPTGYLSETELDSLWAIFEHIVDQWHDGKIIENNPNRYYGQWHEFVSLNTEQEPSYLNEYRSALSLMEELESLNDTCFWPEILVNHNMNVYLERNEDPTLFPQRATRLGHFKIYVIDEFIDVFLACGGYEQFGANNYNGFIYASRFG